MKTISKFLAMVMFAVLALGFASCSGEDGGDSVGEFFEVTFDGVTTKVALEKTWISSNREFNFVSSGEIEYVDFMLTTYADLKRLASAPVGEYRFCPWSEPQNFDFDITCFKDGISFDGETGTHTVTSVKRSGDKVVVEGNFSGVLETGFSVSGKYRIAVW